MKISDWLDQNEAQGIDVNHLAFPAQQIQQEDPDETIFFKEIRICSILCSGNHPFATVERYDHWYLCRGKEKDTGPHTTKPQWWLFTKDRELAIKTARLRIGQ